MKIWSIAVDNRIVVYILMVLIVMFGWTSYNSLPREAAPDVKIPLIMTRI